MMRTTNLNVKLNGDSKLGVQISSRNNLGVVQTSGSSYNSLYGKPKINGVTLEGDKSSADLHISGEAGDIVHQDTTANWNAQRDLVAQASHIYVYTDYMMADGVPVAGIKIGDGNAFLIDIPFVGGNIADLYDHINNQSVHITDDERLFWNNKVTCFMSQGTEETIVFTKENIDG